MAALPFHELKALIVLNRLTTGGGQKVRTLLAEGLPPAQILARIEVENFLDKAEALEKLKKVFDPERELELADQKGIRFLTLADSEYPSLLKQIYDPPIVLYVRGSLLESDQAAVAVVGSRHPSFYGLNQAKQFSRDLAQAGLTIVSGLARGIDQAAHEAAIEISHGRSIAVLGCGVDKVYPPENRKIYEALFERGAVLSEYALGTPPLAENFPRRNRIISGLSLGVFVVEAHARSGSLITAHEALDQGRDVFALPGPVDQLTSRGTHRLLKEGACLVENAQDILDVLAPSLWPLIAPAPGTKENSKVSSSVSVIGAAGKNIPPFTENEQLLMELLGKHPLTYDEMVERCSFQPGAMASLLVGLELKREIRKEPGGRFMALKH